MNLIEQIEEILTEKVKIFSHPFVVSVHQTNDDWFVVEFLIPTIEYKNWFNHLRGKGKEWIFSTTVPYLIKDLVEARQKNKLKTVLLDPLSQFLIEIPRKTIKRSQLRKWDKVYQNAHHRLYTMFCTCGRPEK